VEGVEVLQQISQRVEERGAGEQTEADGRVHASAHQFVKGEDGTIDVLAGLRIVRRERGKDRHTHPTTKTKKTKPDL
jgi:hypothetical protein